VKFWFDHLPLVVPDPEKLADFFVNAFGAEKVSVNKLSDGRIRSVLNIAGGRMLINIPKSSDTRSPDSPQKRYGTEHFGMQVDELDIALQQCQDAGAKLVQGVT
jgi:hypothetical protein